MKNAQIGEMIRELASICTAPHMAVDASEDGRLGEIFTTLAREWTRIQDECGGRE